MLSLKKIASVVCLLLTFVLFAVVAPAEEVQAAVGPEDEGPVYIFNALWFSPHQGQERYADYAEKALPLLLKHGGEPIGIYRPTVIFEGAFSPDAYVMVKWPSLAAAEAFWADSHYQGLKARRAKSLRDSILIVMQPTPGFPLPGDPLPGDGVNEPVFMLNVLWFKSNGGAELYADYLQKVGPIGDRYGAHGLGFFTPRQVLEGELDADEIGLVQWPNAQAVESLFADPDFQPLAAQRAAALEDSWLIQSEAMNNFLSFESLPR